MCGGREADSLIRHPRLRLIAADLSAHALYQADQARLLLLGLLGDVPIAVSAIAADDKVLQYTSDLERPADQALR